MYTTLDRLERDGLVDAVADADDATGRRRLYSMTPEGRAALRSWLDASTWSTEPQRDELLMKVLLVADRPEVATAVIADHRRALLSHLQGLRRDQRAQGIDRDDDLPAQLVADALVARLEADLHWLDRCEQRLTSRRST